MKEAYKLRTSIIFLLFCLGYFLILFNLYSIQIKQRSFFGNLAKQQYNVTITNTPERALIYDRHQIPLALNKHSLSAFIMPKKVEHLEQLEQFLKKQFPQAWQRWCNHPDAHFLYVKRKLSPEQLALLEEKNIPDIKLLKEPNRFYPIEPAGPIVGITDIDNVGQFGIEMLFNQQLAGIPTTYTLEKDARSGYFYFTKSTKQEGIDGQPITLTIDSDLQFLVHENLKESVETFHAQEGAVVIMNPDNGEILAMTQYPDFDPNNTQDIAIECTKNKALTDVYELGSVMKVFVALAALEENLVNSDELIDCENTKTTMLNNIRINTWRPHGIIPFAEVIQNSNNIGIAKVAMRLGSKLYDHYLRLGFGHKTGLSWPGEQLGFVNPPKNWSKPSIVSLSFGYEITANLVQLSRAFCVIANNGYLVAPKLFLADANSEKSLPQQLYSSSSLEVIRDILEKTVTQGTAHRAALSGYRVMGKTGTANLIIDGSYNPDHNRFTFAGIIEKGNYKRVIVTYIQNAAIKNLYASQVAAPLFMKVAENLVIHEKMV
jgi:cell division protein FtsI/penicillin-binding protein 2